MTTYPDVSTSLALYKRAGALIPGWTQLISRRASMYAAGISPIYVKQATGSRLIDVDENEYIDWISGFGAIVLGHADQAVDQAVKAQIDCGSITSLNSPLEIELAEELVNTVPSAQMVRYTKGGGEACALAVRIARGVTDRDKVLFCGYHGWHDWYQAGYFMTESAPGVLGLGDVEPIGVPRALAGTAIPFPYGDVKALESLLRENAGDVAAIMMEPLRSQESDPGYLKRVKALAQEHDVVLIFDEVSSGWRVRVGGAQQYLGVTPDMSVLAKAISNGYPMGAVVGSRDVMEPAKRMFISSSYWSDSIGLVAALTTIRELKRRDSEARFREIGASLKAALNAAISASGLHGACTGLYAHPSLTFELPDAALRPMVNTLFIQEMARRGVHCLPYFYLNLAHTEEDIRLTAAAAAGAFAVIKSGLEAGDLDSLLDCDIKREPFRRLVI